MVGFFKNRSGSVRLVVMSLCIGTICTISGLFFFVPGILAFAFLSFAIPVLVIDGAEVSTALGRGARLASTRLGALLSLYAVVSSWLGQRFSSQSTYFRESIGHGGSV